MERQNWQRWAGVAGVVTVALFVVAIVVAGSVPKPSDSNDVIKAFFVDNRDKLVWQGWLFSAGGMLFLWWGSAVRSALRRSEGGEGHLANTFFGATVATAALLLVTAAVQTGFIYKAAVDVDANVARAVYDICGMFAVFFGMFLAIAGITFAVLTLRGDGAFPAWTAWVAVVVSLINLIATFVIFSKDGAFSVEGAFGFAGFGANMIWLLLVSILLIRAPEPVT